jgi:hypothetical protein
MQSPQDRPADCVLLDAKVVRVLARFARDDDGLRLLSDYVIADKAAIWLSPQLAGWLLGLSAPTVRLALDGELGRPRQRGTHRFVAITMLERMAGAPITVKQVERMFTRALATGPQWDGFGPLEEHNPDEPFTLEPAPTPRTPAAQLMRDYDLSRRYGYPAREIT